MTEFDVSAAVHEHNAEAASLWLATTPAPGDRASRGASLVVMLHKANTNRLPQQLPITHRITVVPERPSALLRYSLVGQDWTPYSMSSVASMTMLPPAAKTGWQGDVISALASESKRWAIVSAHVVEPLED